MRNVVPRQGTETCHFAVTLACPALIEKCSSPTGDGNIDNSDSINSHDIIEKCSSPTGDGNVPEWLDDKNNIKLKNLVPRQGTETKKKIKKKKYKKN